MQSPFDGNIDKTSSDFQLRISQSRIQALEDKNRLLKECLEEAGVSYADIVSGDAEGVVELYDPESKKWTTNPGP